MENPLKIFPGSASRGLTAAMCRHLGIAVGECETIRFSEGNLFVRVRENVRGADCFIVQATGAPVRLDEPKTGTSYSIGNRSGSSIYAFTLDQPGRYRLAANLAGGSGDAKAVLAIGQGTFGAMVRTIFGALAISFAGLGVAGAIVFTVLWQRSKAKQVATG